MLDPSLRAWVYDTLAQIFDGSLPTTGQCPVVGACPPHFADRIAALETALAGVPGEQLATEHVRVFVNSHGGIPAPPYASCYFDGGLQGPASTWVERAYGEQGLEVETDAGEPADYLPCELEFMFFLVRHEMAARRTGDKTELPGVLAAEKRMLQHLCHWIPRFVAGAEAAHPQPVAAAALRLLEAAVREDLGAMGREEQAGCQESARRNT